ncbi:glutaredoxin family protein [Microbacterium sp. LRZ72]|uniref:glutaredoxin family protein n=1 Tax=Microbacterium sp. LRZ72 TaxID=2942481 RepID=UPI0029A982F1|nr:glutaredoxin family protein [Microbacterium sp. LRZ72]MDX2377781.1 glutaredoxin family protein [Microbacterium sp. LRZ72]
MVSVTVYTTGPACVQCRLTRRRLDEAGIRHSEIDLTLDVNAAARDYVTEDLGYSQAPVVVVDGEPEHHWSGFRPDRIDHLASLNQLSRNAPYGPGVTLGSVTAGRGMS